MWRAYFGPEANIMCLDIRDLSHRIDPAVAKFYQGDQTDKMLLSRIIEENGPLNVVLDDGSHYSKHIIPSFDILYPQMTPTGVYMVEDVSCIYKKRYDGGLKQPGSFMEYTKDLLDRINFAHLKQFSRVDPFGNSTHSISVYDFMVVFERRPKARTLNGPGPASKGLWAVSRSRPVGRSMRNQPVRCRSQRCLNPTPSNQR